MQILLAILLILTSLIETKQSLQYNSQNYEAYSQSQQLSFNLLNYQLEILSPDFIPNFLAYYNQEFFQTLLPIKTNNNQQIKSIDKQLAIGQYLFLVGKMYLYEMYPTEKQMDQLRASGLYVKKGGYQSQSRFVLSYYYLKIAAEEYQYADAYYYLAILQSLKISPTLLVKDNLISLLYKNSSYQHKKNIEDLRAELSVSHLHNIQHNLYLASLLGHESAMKTLGHMFKNGISTQKNCTSSLTYFLNVVKNTKIDIFQFPSDYRIGDQQSTSFEKQLYQHRQADLSQYSEHDPNPLLETIIFNDETLDAYEDIAVNYLSGTNGFILNETKAGQMFVKMQEQSKLSKSMLGFLYLKGRGVPRNYTKARQIFEKGQTKLFKQILLAMKYYGMGYPENQQTRKSAVSQMQKIYKSYVKYKQAQLNETKGIKAIKSQQKQPYERIRAPVLKYLIGSLILASEISGTLASAIELMQESADEGSSLGMAQMALMYVDGADNRFDCKAAVSLLDQQARNHVYFQAKLELAKLAIKKNKLTFSLIKYIQLMGIGIRPSFINAFYLLQIYGTQKVFNFNLKSWSVVQAQKNSIYNYLLENQFLKTSIKDLLIREYNPTNQDIINKNNIGDLTMFDQYIYGQQKQSYRKFGMTKILKIGTEIHEISILKFYQYKLNPNNIDLLEKVASNTFSQPHIYEARYLLGRYYQNNEIDGQTKPQRMKRALQEYQRATKNSILAKIIFIIEGGQTPQLNILNHLAYYITLILAAWFFLNRQKKKRLDEIYQQELNQNMQSEEPANEDNIEKNEEYRKQPMIQEKKQQKQYKGPRFSEQQEEQLLRNHMANNLASVNLFSEQNTITQSDKQEQKLETDYRSIWKMKSEDNNQPIIQEQGQENKKHHFD